MTAAVIDGPVITVDAIAFHPGRPHLLRHALEVTTNERIVLSVDYPFHRIDTNAIDTLLSTLPDPSGQEKVAHHHAATLFNLA
jgi:hypothetical protein